MKNNFKKPKASRSAEVYKLISKIKDVKKRNLLRGYSAKPYVYPLDAAIIRSNNSPHDSVVIGALLMGRNGLLNGNQYKSKRSSNDLYSLTSIPAIAWKNEVCYTSGYINSLLDDAFEVLIIIQNLSRIELLDTEEALILIHEVSKKYGASNYLSYKLAYIRSARDLCSNLTAIVAKIEDEMGHRENVGLHFSALENLSSKVSLFLVAQRRISGLVGEVDGDFRKALSLSNFIPTPLNEDDAAKLLLRATESSLIDTIYTIIIIFNLPEKLVSLRREFEFRLNPKLFQEILKVIEHAKQSPDGVIVTDFYSSESKETYSCLDLYRTCSAFLERPKYALFRNKLDKVIGVRFLSEIIGQNAHSFSSPIHDKELLIETNTSTKVENLPIQLDTFYRTYLFLRYIGDKTNILSLSKEDIKFIFENTVGLDTLLSEEEMSALYLTATPETKSLVSVLALALFRKKSIDPDIDFEFRTDFISHVKNHHQGSVISFIEYLLQDSPQVATYIVNSLDEVTLEKMYTLVKNATEASLIRGDILKAVGEKINRLEFIIQSDAITTRSKLSKLQKYFDSSRMYVDSVAMKKWLDSNPTISSEQYRTLYRNYEAELSSLENSNVLIILLDQEDQLISQIAKDAFEQFCLNTEFGIQSYLGRRIRHNTLDGVTTETVDAVLRKPEFSSFMANPQMQRNGESWMAVYKSIIDKLRRDYLQFESSKSFFNASLDLDDPTTKDNIRSLTNTLRSAGGGELLNELVISFCWKQITPQLENAARFIKTNLLSEANASIDKFFTGNHGATEEQIKSELRQAVNEVLKKVADWFQVPQTGFISASVKDICQIILIDHNRENHVDFSGDAIDIKYTGISVHRLYDCLAVLINNAQKHGKDDKKILVNAWKTRTNPNANLDFVSVDITSTVLPDEYLHSKTRILHAIDTEERGIDMVTEGYTGIKKIKFITRVYEGQHTVRCSPNDETNELKLGFSIHAETEDFEIGK